MSPTLVAALPILLALGSVVWVYTDATQRQRRREPVTVAIGSFELDDPVQWTLACLVLWILFFPLYLTARR
jgi:cytochrome c oxidase assembly factor CtaG